MVSRVASIVIVSSALRLRTRKGRDLRAVSKRGWSELMRDGGSRIDISCHDAARWCDRWPGDEAQQPEEATVKLSARNMLKGKVKKINSGAVNSEVIIETAGGETLVAIITKQSVKSLGLKEGKDVYAVIKASNVMVAVD